MRKTLATLFLIVMICVLVFAQTTTPNLGLQLPAHGTPNYDVILNNNFSIIDTAVGILQNAFQGTWSASTTYSKGQQVSYLGSIYVSLTAQNFNNVPATSTINWGFMFNATGTVSSVGDAAPLFTVNSRTTTPTFVFTNASANNVWAGPASGVPGPPGYRLLVSADLPGTLNSNTTGNASTATALATLPTLCSTGNYARGVDQFGNAAGCTAAGSGGGGPATLTAVSHFFVNSYNSATLTFGTAQPAFGDLTGTATTGQLPGSVVYNNQANTYTSGSKQTFASSSTTAGNGHSGVTADPSSLSAGDEWYRTDTGRLMIRSTSSSQQVAFFSDIPTTFAPSAITGFGSAGNYLRSSGSAWAASTIQVADVPTLNQNTTGKASANVASLTFSVTGTVNSTSGSLVGVTTVPANLTFVSYTLSLGQASAGCTTLPTYQLFDSTSSTVLSTITLVNGTSTYANTSISAAITSGHILQIKVGTSSAGCTTSPATAQFVAWYSMT